MKVEMVAVERLIPYVRNPRRNNGAVDAVAASIREFGFRQPIVVDEAMTILVGHTRHKAAQKLGLATVPVHVAEGLTEAQKKAYRIADNRLNDLAEWDDELLALELEDLRMADFDLSTDALGFEAGEIDDLLASLDDADGAGQGDADAVPEPRPDAISKPGDVWVLGKHRMMCGDSTDPDAVGMLMEGEMADLCFTSPPYGQQRDYGVANAIIKNWDALMYGVFSILPVKESAQILINLGLIHSDGEWIPYWREWLDKMKDFGWRRFWLYCWDQGPGLPGDWSGRFAPAFELIFHFNKIARKPNKTKECAFAGEENHGSGLRAKDGSVTGYSHAGQSVQSHKIPDSVVRVMRHKARGIEVEHPAVFPVLLVEEIVSAYSNQGECLYEPFGGSGTTLIACEKTGRRARLMELDPRYVDIAIRRWQDFTGHQATLEATGETFDTLTVARSPSAARASSS